MAKSYNKNSYTKKSGCTMQKSYVVKDTGEQVDYPIIRGWRISKTKGMTTFSAFPRKGKDLFSDPSKVRDADDKLRYVVTMNFEDDPVDYTLSATWNSRTNKLYIHKVNLVASPKGNFFGKVSKK